MRRLLAGIVCIFLLAATVFADNAIASASSTAVVTQRGSCQITLTATLRLEHPVENLRFALGPEVTDVTVNGTLVTTTKADGQQWVKLAQLKNQTGSIPITIQYTIPAVVSMDEAGQQLVTVPVLSGFPYPVEQMIFTITMPGTFTGEPVFRSGYHDVDIQRSINYSINGSVITASVTQPLKDSETLRMILEAPEGMFPLPEPTVANDETSSLGMAGFAALSVLYWVLTMGHMPTLPQKRSTPPEGLSAGTVGTYLVHQGADLTLMVMSWAQLGYLIIHLDKSGRVFLRRKMKMGNERSSFERKCFRSLFHKGEFADATSYRYARLMDSVAQDSRRQISGLRRGSGNPLLLRILASGVSFCAGMALGSDLIGHGLWRLVVMGSLGMAFVVLGWISQSGMRRIHLMDRTPLGISLAASAVMMVAGLLCGKPVYGVLAGLWNPIMGIAAAYGGHRSTNGQRMYTGILGLRRHMKLAQPQELTRFLRANPDYFYELAPYALALGVDRTFAQKFDQLKLPSCEWLMADRRVAKSASDWNLMLREAVTTMNRKAKR